MASTAPPLWNPNAAGLWSVLLSPIFGSVLLRENWKSLGDPEKARAGGYWIAASIVMAFVSMLAGIAGFIYILIWYFAWQKPQAVHVRERWGSAYPRRRWGAPLLVGFIACLLVVMSFYIVARSYYALERG
jgi:hypothetical protein